MSQLLSNNNAMGGCISFAQYTQWFRTHSKLDKNIPMSHELRGKWVSERASERTSEHNGARERSEQCGASERISEWPSTNIPFPRGFEWMCSRVLFHLSNLTFALEESVESREMTSFWIAPMNALAKLRHDAQLFSIDRLKKKENRFNTTQVHNT